MSHPAKSLAQLGLSGRYTLVVGLAREGMALADYLARHGAKRVVATDVKSAQAFKDNGADWQGQLSQLAAAGVDLALGGHPLSLLDGCDIAFVSPGVPFDAPFLNQARSRGIPLSTESRLFCQLCPAAITGISGSSGKTTTTTLVAEMLKADGRKTWVGGNIGHPLISELDQIGPDEDVVMELSSFQLEYYHPSANAHVLDGQMRWLPLLSGWSPAVSAILNIAPNHLDRHASMDAYVHAKRAIVAYRRPWDVAVMGWDNQLTRDIGGSLCGQVRYFSRKSPVSEGACLSDKAGQAWAVLRDGYREQSVCKVSDIRLRGEHNVNNVLAACTVADALDVSVEAMRQVSTGFRGVRHRLEWVGQWAGADYYNDSIATSPERLAAALNSFEEPVILLAGGRDKHLPWDEAAGLILQRTRHLILFGEAADLIDQAVSKARGNLAAEGAAVVDPAIHRCDSLAESVSAAARLACPGDVVLLSPGCTSFDAFVDFEQRGDLFRQLVAELAGDQLSEGSLT